MTSIARYAPRRTAFAVGVLSAAAAALATAGAFAQTQQSPQGQPPAPQAAPQAKPLSDQDKAFIKKAAQDDTMQVELGKLAAGQAQSPKVRRFALQSAETFSSAGGTLEAIARNMGAQLPQQPDPDTRKLAQALAADPTAVVDEEYLAQIVPASTVAVNVFESEAEGGQNPKLKQFASTFLPKLRQQRNTAVRLAENPGPRGPKRNRAFPPQPAGKL